jgi:NhaP-type Na+/H+ or K+/H+ antiporter
MNSHLHARGLDVAAMFMSLCGPDTSSGHSPAPSPGHGHNETGDGHIPAGGHLGDLWRTQQCVPIACEPENELHSPGSEVHGAQSGGCRNYNVYNFMTDETEELSLTCQACVPRVCGHGEHDCVPVYCEDEHGDLHGGHTSDPCSAGHHSDDGLSWWPFLLLCLVSTVAVTVLLDKLSHGAICGKNFGLPFTVVMFFFGYTLAQIYSDDSVAESSGHTVAAAASPEHQGVIAGSVAAWKQAHPHVILFVLLPPLLFEDASSMDYYVLRKVLKSSIILAGPGVAISMILTAITTMALFGFATECVIEVDPISGEQIVAGAAENTMIDGVYVCDPEHNPHWQQQTGPDGGLICLECVEGSYESDQLPVAVHLLLGGMLAATDPVAVCAVLNDLGCPEKLNYMIAGESLLNDGTAVVAFLVMQSVAGGCDTTAAKVMISLVRLAGGGVLWGLFMASVAYNSIKHVRNPNIEITTLVVCTLATFWLAENILGVSGVLGTVVFGIQSARTSFLAMDEHTHHANHAFWSEVGYVATAIIFILAGVKSQTKIEQFVSTFHEDFLTGEDELCSETDELTCIAHHRCRWDGAEDTGLCSYNNATQTTDAEFHVSSQLGANVVLYLVMTVIRAAVVALFAPVLTKIGYGLSWKEAVVMVWGGLRGAVSLSLALLVDGNHLIGDRAREMIFLQTTGIVTLTLIINGTTAGIVYKWLQVYPPNPFRPVLSTQGLRDVQDDLNAYIRKMRHHWFHMNVDWEILSMLIPDFSAARMVDGDLVDVKTQDMEDSWTCCQENILLPMAFLTSDATRMASSGINIVDFCQKQGLTNFDSRASQRFNGHSAGGGSSGHEPGHGSGHSDDDHDSSHGNGHGHGHGHGRCGVMP